MTYRNCIQTRTRRQIENDLAAQRYAADERTDAAAQGIKLPVTDRTSRSGRTFIWNIRPDAITFCYVDNSHTNRYRDVKRVNLMAQSIGGGA